MASATETAHALQALTHRAAYEIVSRTEIDTIFDGGWWDDSYARFPDSDGFLELAPIGLSRDGLHALVRESYAAGGEACGGTIKYFVKRDGVWVQERRGVCWEC